MDLNDIWRLLFGFVMFKFIVIDIIYNWYKYKKYRKSLTHR